MLFFTLDLLTKELYLYNISLEKIISIVNLLQNFYYLTLEYSDSIYWIVVNIYILNEDKSLLSKIIQTDNKEAHP